MNTRGRIFRDTIVAFVLFVPAALHAQGPVSTGLATPGLTDPSWYVVDPASPSGIASAYVLSRGFVPGGYGWIAVTPSGTVDGGQPDGNFARFSYVFETTFTGGGITGATFQCASDDGFASIMLNGTLVDGGGCDQYNPVTDRTLAGFLPGANVLRFTSTGNGVTDGLMVHFTSVTGDLTVTPEPSSLVLLATGLAGVVGAIRRKHGMRRS